jgi:hypothetical protein
MKKALVYMFCGIVSLQQFGCKKSSNDNNTSVIDYTYEAADSLIFEHTGQINYSVKINSTTGKEFSAALTEINGAFSLQYNNVSIPSNETRNIPISFNQYNVVPDLYPCKLSLVVPNENNSTKTKTVWLVYRPNCAYSFKDHINGDITYVTNGQLNNKSIVCTYNDDGQLQIAGLAPFYFTLNFDCAAQTVTMKQITHLNSLITGNGTISNNQINFQMYNDGALNAVLNIKP